MSEQARNFLEQATQAIQDSQFQTAIELVDQALAIDISLGDAHLLKGIALAQTGQPDAATESFRQSISFSPNNPKAYYNFATHLYQQGNKVEAQAMAQEALRLDPAHSGARDLLRLMDQETQQVASRTENPAGAPPPYTSVQSGVPPQSYAGGIRPGYYQPVHSVAFIEKMGEAKWVRIGWILIIILFIGTIVGNILSFGNLSKVLSTPDAGANTNPFEMMGLSGPVVAITILQMIAWFGLIFWTVMDIMDRRLNWAWILLVLCCSPWLAPIYMAVGRKSNPMQM